MYDGAKASVEDKRYAFEKYQIRGRAGVEFAERSPARAENSIEYAVGGIPPWKKCKPFCVKSCAVPSFASLRRNAAQRQKYTRHKF